jgi:hypothetical protein
MRDLKLTDFIGQPQKTIAAQRGSAISARVLTHFTSRTALKKQERFLFVVSGASTP